MPLAKFGRIVATAVAISVGVVVLMSYFVQRLTNLGAIILVWAAVVIAFSLLLVVINLLRVHINQIQTRQRGWFYSAILIISLAITLIIGPDGPASP